MVFPTLILFNEDWNKVENKDVIADYTTSNRAFLDMAGLLHDMGINNHKFMLQLHNKELVGVDPYAKDLTEYQKQLVASECGTNPIYIIREIIRITVTATPEPVKFAINRASLATFWSFFVGLTIYVVLQRQVGKTVTLSTLISILIGFMLVNSDINLMTKDSKLRSQTVDMIKDIMFNLPDYLQLADHSKNKGSEGFVVGPLENSLKVHLAQRSVVAAEQVGRGLTSPVNIFDEFGFLYNLQAMLTAALSSGTTARELAKENNLPFGTLFFTTAAYLHTKSGKFAKKIYDGAFRFTEDLYDAPNKEAVRSIVEENSTGLGDILLIEFNHRQLGKTDSWLAKIIKENLADPLKAAAEFMNIWSNASSSSALKPSQIKYIQAHIKEPVFTSMFNGLVIRWYVTREELDMYKNIKSFVIGIDSSDMLDSDSTSINITDPTTGATLGAGSFRLSLISDFEIALADIMLTYTKSVLIIESRSTGVAITDALFKVFRANGINIFHRVFNWLVSGDNPHNEVYTNDDYLENKRHFGYKTRGGTGKNSRVALYDDALYRVVDMFGDRLYDKKLVDDMSKLEEKNNRIVHQAKEHDDTVIARLLTDWLLLHAKNISAYGLLPGTILTDISKAGQEDMEEVKLIREINKLMEERSVATTPIQKLLIKTKILKLSKKLPDGKVKTLNLQERFDESIEKKGIVHKVKRFMGIPKTSRW